MAIVFEEALKKNIKADGLLPVYILFGEDGYLKKSYSDKILKLVAEPDDIFNCSKFGGDCSLQEAYDSAMQLPFMADKKYIEICDFDFEHCSKSDFDRLCQLVSDIPDTAVLVLRFDSVEFDQKKSSKFKKLATACEKNGGITVNLSHRKLPELVKMLCDGAKKRGSNMESSAARYLVETAGEDINLLKNELIKLCAYSGGNTITKETVENVSVKTVEASVFNLSRYILECNVSESLKILDELFFMRVEPMSVLYTISGVYVDMLRVFSANSQSVPLKEVDEAYSYKSKAFLLDKAKTNLRKFDKNKLNLSLNALTEADKNLKSFGAEPRIILEQLIIRLIYIIAKGESVDTP